MLRNTLSVILGLLAALLATFGIFSLLPLIYDMPIRLDWSNISPLLAILRFFSLPAIVLLFLALVWLISAFIGSTIASLISAKAKVVCGYTTSAIMFALAVSEMIFLLPPWWLWLLAIVVFAPAAWFGTRLGTKLNKAAV